jgi:hypothetical protein
MTAINSPIPLQPAAQRRGYPVDDFVDRLSRPSPGHASGAMVSLLQALISFGMLPLLLWPTRWAEFLESERHDLIDLAAWYRRRVDADEALRLDKIVKRLRPRPLLMVLPWLAVGFNAVMMVTLLILGDDLGRLWDLSFDYHVRHPYLGGPMPLNQLEPHLFWAWNATLTAAYICQWYAVRSHTVVVNRLVGWTNRLARENRFMQIRNETLRLGLNPLWIIIGVGLIMHQTWWAIPMVFAGALQRTYSTKSSPQMRVALAAQARHGFAVVQSRGDRFCAAGHCGARLPGPAKFCPRCGTAV